MEIPFLEQKVEHILRAHDAIYQELGIPIGSLDRPSGGYPMIEVHGDIDFLMNREFGLAHKWLAYASFYFFHKEKEKRKQPNDTSFWDMMWLHANLNKPDIGDGEHSCVSPSLNFVAVQANKNNLHYSYAINFIGGAGISSPGKELRRKLTLNNKPTFGNPGW